MRMRYDRSRGWTRPPLVTSQLCIQKKFALFERSFSQTASRIWTNTVFLRVNARVTMAETAEGGRKLVGCGCLVQVSSQTRTLCEHVGESSHFVISSVFRVSAPKFKQPRKSWFISFHKFKKPNYTVFPNFSPKYSCANAQVSTQFIFSSATKLSLSLILYY